MVSKWQKVIDLEKTCNKWWDENKETPTLHKLYSDLKISRQLVFEWGKKPKWKKHFDTIKNMKEKIIAELTKKLIEGNSNKIGIIFYLKCIDKEWRQAYQDKEHTQDNNNQVIINLDGKNNSGNKI